MKPVVFFLLLNFFKTPCAVAQDAETPTRRDTLSAKKIYLIAGVHAASYAGTLAVLSTTWYNGYAKTSFHLFDDSKEWLQLDKAGHAWTAYNIANYSSRLWRWAGINNRNAALLGGFSALGYQTILEFLDAHSAKWGWSWADMGANTFGAALFTTQALVWQKQKVALKFSSFPQRYNQTLRPRVDDLFGNTFPERLLKDYNAQTYWLSFNLDGVAHATLPVWLNVAVGYGANGLYGGFENRAHDTNGVVTFDRRDIQRLRQWYLSPDVDWTKFKTHKKAVRTLFSLLNMIKLPAPAIEFTKGKLHARWVSF